jgi:tetratricopeptide (TPR) repeat protein
MKKSNVLPIRGLALAMILALSATGAFAARTEEADEPATDGSGMPADPRVEAVASYNRAVRYRDEAWELERKAAQASSEKAAAKLLKKAGKEYEKATRALHSAIQDDPTLHQAWTTLGYTLRKSGEFGEALAAYDRALELRPGFPEAVEYRAEAYLGLGRVDEAREAYMELLRADREHADELLAAMRKWVDERRGASGDLESAAIEEFASWVDERSKLAEQASLGASGATW